MYTAYLQWQLVTAPAFLLTLFWNLERALWRYFSVPHMLRTLFSYWHKDKVSYRQGSFSGMVKAFAWNSISRGVGAVVRVTLLALWLITFVILTAGATALFLLFMVWPLLVLLGVAVGLAVISSG